MSTMSENRCASAIVVLIVLVVMAAAHAGSPSADPDDRDVFVVDTFSELARRARSDSIVVLEGDVEAGTTIRIPLHTRNLTLRFNGTVTWTGADTADGLIRIPWGARDIEIEGLHLVMADADRRVSGVQTIYDEGAVEAGRFATGITIRDCEMERPRFGVVLEGGADGVVIENLRATDCLKYAIYGQHCVRDLEIRDCFLSLDPVDSIEHTVRLYAVEGMTMTGSTLINQTPHGSEGTFKRTFWLLECDEGGAHIEDNEFIGGRVTFGYGAVAGGTRPVRDVVFRANTVRHERTNAPIEIGGGVEGCVLIDNVVESPMAWWAVVSGTGNDRAPAVDVHWRGTTFNHEPQEGTEGIRLLGYDDPSSAGVGPDEGAPR